MASLVSVRELNQISWDSIKFKWNNKPQVIHHKPRRVDLVSNAIYKKKAMWWSLKCNKFVAINSQVSS